MVGWGGVNPSMLNQEGNPGNSKCYHGLTVSSQQMLEKLKQMLARNEGNLLHAVFFKRTNKSKQHTYQNVME